MENIREIFSKYPKIGKQKYADFYTRHFADLEPSILLEIGVAKGFSLKAWQEIFPDCKIAGIDIDPLCKLRNPDLNIFTGDQKDTDFLTSVIDEVGLPDIIIDDGGHKRSQQISTFTFLFPQLISGGIYIIEDLQTNYLQQWNDFPFSAIDYLKHLLDPTGFFGTMSYTSLTFEPNNAQPICMVTK